MQITQLKPYALPGGVYGSFARTVRTLGAPAEVWYQEDEGLTWYQEDEGLIWYQEDENMPTEVDLLVQDPDEDQIYGMDFSKRTTVKTDPIASVVGGAVTISPSGPTIGTPSIQNNGTLVAFEVSGLTAGVEYELYALCQTQGGLKVKGKGRLKGEYY